MASDNIQILGAVPPQYTDVLSDDALEFVAELHRNFETTRQRLMQARVRRQAEIDGGATPDFLAETRSVREGDWQVQPAPADLTNRRVEITGPSSNRRMVINALNCGAQVYMTDFEDAHSPAWLPTLDGQTNVRDAYRRIISDEAADGRQYRLNEDIATLCVRPRGLHLMERHVLVDGEPVAGSFFDFGLTVFHNHVAQQSHGTGPYYYLPKLQSYLEARLWNDVFRYAEERLGIPTGTISPTVLIEHILAAFEMEEILYELRERPAGLNLGRWGLHLQRDQGVQWAQRYGVPRPGAGDDGDALPDVGSAFAGQHLSPPGRARVGRHVGVHSAPGRCGGQRSSLRPGEIGQAAGGRPGL